MLPATELFYEVEHLKEHFSLYYQLTGDGQNRIEGTCGYHSPLDFPYNNVVLGVPRTEADRAIKDQLNFFEGPWVWYVDISEEDFKTKIVSHGFQDQGILSGVVCPLESLPKAQLNPEFEWKRVEDKETFDAFVDVICEVFNFTEHDNAWMKKILWNIPEMTHWVALKDHKVVSTLTSILKEDTVSFWNGATLPEYRRCGITTNLGLLAAQWARAQGATWGASYLLPGSHAYAICMKLGFKPIWKFHAFLAPSLRAR